jgi:hypothetical protein
LSRRHAHRFRRSRGARTMFYHRLLRLDFVGARGNAFAIGKHEPLMEARFRDDVLGHFRRPSSKLTQLSTAGLLAH